MLGFKKMFLSTRLSRLLKILLEWQVILPENTCAMTLFEVFFYITTHRGKEISPIQVILEFPHIEIGEGQHRWCY